MNLPPVVTDMFITSTLGIVHRLEGACDTGLMAPRRQPVTRNQCWVYKLPSCRECWPVDDEYLMLVGLPSARRPK
jgi:hypothetical protein